MASNDVVVEATAQNQEMSRAFLLKDGRRKEVIAMIAIAIISIISVVSLIF